MLSLLLAASAYANGQTSHVWITLHALELLPPGELHDFLNREDLRQMLLNGTMFPDGGYPQHDDYGEMAHWEPFQGDYREWIMAQGKAPYSEELAPHAAFYLGMASHGMADQVYDSLFMERAHQYDASSDWGAYSMDEATDVHYAAAVGPLVPPEDWVPYDAFLSLYSEAGHPVSLGLLQNGQKLLRTAINYVGAVSQVPSTLDKYEQQFPWATTHQVSPSANGRPDVESEIIVRYWQVLWDRLQGTSPAVEPLLATFPEEDGRMEELDHSRVESRVSVVFPRGIDTNHLDTSLFSVKDQDGSAVPCEVNVFYGYSSHVVHLKPQQDWQKNTDYTIQIAEGVPYFDGGTAGASVIHFTTRPPAAKEEADEPKGCSVSGVSALWLGLLALAGVRRGAASSRIG